MQFPPSLSDRVASDLARDDDNGNEGRGRLHERSERHEGAGGDQERYRIPRDARVPVRSEAGIQLLTEPEDAQLGRSQSLPQGKRMHTR